MALEEMYQELIVDHGRRPRNFGELPDATHSARSYNPLCGDEIEISLRVQDGVIVQCKFTGCGCAISQAAASLLTERVTGMKLEDAKQFFGRFRSAMVDGDVSESEALGEFVALLPVREYPMRVKCATLAGHTLIAALEHPKDAGNA
ncbi:MAG: SUF system NifU family Fe-S cluster assembly protein [Chthonomonas sp.]|nr:SUF system NifU family Fe-S cluster assembly protein [Chthonomonas sp.]